MADLLCARQVTELRSLIAAAGGLPVDRLKLLSKGKPLQDGDKAKGLQTDGTVTCGRSLRYCMFDCTPSCNLV